MSKFKVVYDTYTENLGGQDPDDEWSRDSPEKTHTINGLVLVNENEYFDVVSEYTASVGDEFLLLYATYYTGDTFGRDGGQIEFIHVYPPQLTDYVAENVKRIAKHAQDYRDGVRGTAASAYTVKLLDNTGADFEYGVPWNGYSEGLDGVDYVLLKVEGKQ